MNRHTFPLWAHFKRFVQRSHETATNVRSGKRQWRALMDVGGTVGRDANIRHTHDLVFIWRTQPRHM